MTEWIRSLIIERGKHLTPEEEAAYAKAGEAFEKLREDNIKMWEEFDQMFNEKGRLKND